MPTRFFAMLPLCVFMPLAQAANLWSWDANNTQTSSGTCNLASAVIDSSEKIEGTASMRITITAAQTVNGCRDLPLTNFNIWSGTWRYYRWWMKIDPNFNWGNDARKVKASRVIRQTQTSPGAWTGYVDHQSIYLGECALCEPGPNDPSSARVFIDLNPAGGCSGTNSGVAYNCTQWTEYIVGIKLQSCQNCFDGEFHVWVNGGNTGSVTGMNFYNNISAVTEAWTTFMVSPFSQVCPNSSVGCTAGGTIWVDDFSIDDRWNSSVGPQPNPPTLLPIQ